jgi:thiamine pyrophosphate-dependent acetolactate synthase large subunit-like protein
MDVDLVLAGRGVVRAGRVADLQAFADRVGIGVLNTYTAKGVFKWDSPYHFGTGCLQERDLALAGVREGARVLVVGVDEDECAPALLRAAGVDASSLVAIEVSELPSAQVRSAAGTELKPPPLYYAIFDIAQPLYRLTDSPLNPARAAADIAEVLPDGSAVCVEPGLPGLWVGRTLPTRYLGSARVPAAGRPGTAVAGALLGALEGTRRVAIVAEALSEPDERLLEWARAAGLNVTVIVWTLDAPARNAEEHRAALAEALAAPGVTVLPVAVDLAATQLLVDAAGPLVAW